MMKRCPGAGVGERSGVHHIARLSALAHGSEVGVIARDKILQLPVRIRLD